MSLWDLIRLCETRHCHDPRDTVYGTLAISYWRVVNVIGPDGFLKDPDPISFYCHGEFKPDYARSAWDLAKELALHFDQMEDLSRLLGQLRITSTDPQVLAAIRKRQEIDPHYWKPVSDDEILHSAKPYADQVLLVGGYFQLLEDSNFKLIHRTSGGSPYAQVVDLEGQLCAFASSCTQLND